MSDDNAVKDAEYFMQHPEEFEALSAEDQEAFMFGGIPQGETKSEASPDLTDKQDPEPAKEATTDKPVVDTPVVQAKDGVHTIPYSELEAAREKAARFEQTAQEQAMLIEDLKAAKAKDAETGGTEAQEAVMAEYAGEYPELMEDLKPYLDGMMAGVIKRMSDLESKIAQDLQPIQEDKAKAATKAHFDFILEKHPDSEEIAASQEFVAWINSQPSFVRDRYEQIAQNGSAEQVVEMLDAYRKVNPATSDAGKEPDLGKTVEGKLAQVKNPVPSSLSEVPGGAAAHHDEAEAMADMSPLALMAKFNNMSPDKIEENMSRII